MTDTPDVGSGNPDVDRLLRLRNALAEESAVCARCGQRFYAPAGHDPLKRHDLDCEGAPCPEE